MAGLGRSESKLSLEIRTKSIEQTLVPLVTQITTLVNHKEKPCKSDKTLRALVRVGQAVNLAVERFVTVGESIAEENPEIRHDMCEACKEARTAGGMIQQLTDIPVETVINTSRSVAEKTAMVRAARQLLSAITKVLILADRVVVKQLLAAKAKVTARLDLLESVHTFSDFVKAFSEFGNQMVELAHLTGDRQNDLKSEKHRTQMGASRAILEKSTMMLLTSSKTLLRHPECDSARRNRETVFSQMRSSLDVIHRIVTDTSGGSGQASPIPAVNGDSGISLVQPQSAACRALREFDDLVEMTRVTLVGPNTEEKLKGALDTVLETTQDFTDSAYTSHQHRERILYLCERVRQELTILLKIGISLDQRQNSSPNQELETAIIKTKDASRNLKKQLQDTAMEQASDVFRTSEDHELLQALKLAGQTGEALRVKEMSIKFEEHSEQLQEVAKLLRHMAHTEALIITTEHAENWLKYLAPQINTAAQTLAMHPASKIGKENLDVFGDAWVSQINDLSVLVKDVNEVCQGKSTKQVYLSLPRPGEQAKIAKLGLEMKLITSEMDAETEKWGDEPDNEMVKRSKNMSSMAFSMYLFTRGEGPLKTTQDLFTQAEYYGEEGAKLFKAVKEFSQKIPMGPPRTELSAHLERIPILCQQLNFTIKSPTVGKAATFNKVDSAIQETKNLMNAVAKVVTTCFICATKYNVDYRMSPRFSNKWKGQGLDPHGYSSDGSDRESVKSSRSDSLMRSSSLNSKPLTSFNSYDKL